MKIVSNVQVNIPNRHLRRIKYKLYKLKEKFDVLIYSQLYIKSEGSKRKNYHLKLILGVPGKDIIVSTKGESLELVIDKNLKNANRQLAKMNRKLSA